MSNPIQVKQTDAGREKEKRIKALKTLMPKIILGVTRREALGLIETFQKGIKNQEFGLEPLAKSTKDGKRRKGYKQPETPLYGKGLDLKKGTYIRCLRISPLGTDGWTVGVSDEPHHESKYTLKQLVEIHENGFWVKNGASIFKIPQRPAIKKAAQVYKSKFKALRKKQMAEVDKAVRKYLAKGDKAGIMELIKRAKEGREHEKRN